MRRIPKFKIFAKSRSILLPVPKKITKFKHSKWKKIKTKCLKINKKRSFFNFLLTGSTNVKYWDKKKLFFKNKLILRKSFYQTFDSSLKYKNLKKGGFLKQKKFTLVKMFKKN